MTRPYPQHFPQASVASSGHKPFVGQSPVFDAVNERFQTLGRVPANIAVIKPPSEFIDVSASVARADVMEGAVNAALQDCPSGLNAIRGNVAVDVQLDVFARRVIDRLVPEEQTVHARVGFRFIGVQRRTLLNSRMNDRLQGSRLGVTDGQQDRFAMPLAQSHDRHFADSTTAKVQLFPLVLAGFLPADIGFVNFDVAGKDCLVVATGFANAVHHEPRAFLSDADLLRHLQRRYRLAGCDHQVHGINPLVKWDVRAFKDRIGSHRKVLIAGVAAIEASLARPDPLAGITDRTDGAVRPKTRFQVDAGRFRIREHFEDFKSADCASTHKHPSRRAAGETVRLSASTNAPFGVSVIEPKG